MSREGKAVEMSADHKPEDDVEHTRIKKAGGKVTPDGRVNGGLNLSRAIGANFHLFAFLVSGSDADQTNAPNLNKVDEEGMAHSQICSELFLRIELRLK